MIPRDSAVSALSAAVAALDEALALSERMRVLAEAGEWSAFGQLEARRQALLHQDANPLPDDPAVRMRLESLLALNRELENLCTAARDRVAVALRGQKRKDRAIRSYQAMDRR